LFFTSKTKGKGVKLPTNQQYQSPRVPGFYEYVKEQWKVHIQDDKKPNN
jgi:hypothetical protein